MTGTANRAEPFANGSSGKYNRKQALRRVSLGGEISSEPKSMVLDGVKKMMSGQTPESGPQVESDVLPPHVVSPAVRRQLQQCYDHACKLLEQDKPDRDYAHTLLLQCVVADPGNLVYVEAFLKNLQEKYGNNRRGAWSLFGGGGRNRSEFKRAVAKGSWSEVLKLGPELLYSNPWDVGVLRGMAQACAAYHYNEVELRYLKNALDANPKDIEVNRHCAQSLARMGQFGQAIACWHRIEELRPHDQEAKRMIAELTVERARPQISGATAARRSATRSHEAAPSAAGKAAVSAPEVSSAEPTDGAAAERAPDGTSGRRSVELSPIQRLEKAIHDEPEILENYFELIDLYVESQRFTDAERVWQRVHQIAPTALEVIAKGEELLLAVAEHQLAVAKKQAAAQRTPQAEELVARCEEELLRRQLTVWDARCQRFPEDHQLKLELAAILKRAGNFQAAAERLHEARRDPNLAARATLELGECYQHLRQYVKALHCYQRAAEKAVEQPGQVAIQKTSLYRAGVLAAAMKEHAIAERCLEQLVAIDPNFKDAKSRLDKLREISDK